MGSLRNVTVEGFWLTPCVYCGMAANSRDHVVPLSWRRMISQWRTLVDDDVPDTVPSCLECNSTAGSKVFPTLADKRMYVQGRYRDKYAKLLTMPFWPQSELDELSDSLRAYVEQEETRRCRLLLRLCWPYELADQIEALTRYLLRNEDISAALNEIRRNEILA